MKNQISIHIVSDHAGFELKDEIIKHFQPMNQYNLIDYGTNSNQSVNYAIVGQNMISEMVMHLTNTNETRFGIMICGSGIGMSIIANRHQKVRAALCFNEECAILSRMHNDANVICLGAKFLNKENAITMINEFINTKFEGGRHCARVDVLSNSKFD